MKTWEIIITVVLWVLFIAGLVFLFRKPKVPTGTCKTCGGELGDDDLENEHVKCWEERQL